MKAIALIALLVINQFVCGSDTTSVKVSVRSALETTKPFLSITFDGDSLVIQNRQQPTRTVPLSKQELSSLRKAVSAFKLKDWSGVWVQIGVLDGTILVGRLVKGDKNSEFIGVNGCPPGFAEFAKLVDQTFRREVFGKGWNEMERTAEHFNSLEAVAKDATRKRETKSD
jgi:hypothetical protein